MTFLMQPLPIGKMNSTEVIKYLKNPALLTESTLPSLEQLVLEFPWFQTGWLLYLKNLHNLNHSAYPAVLNHCAIRIGNRKEIKKFVENSNYKEVPTLYFNERQYHQDGDGADASVENGNVTPAEKNKLQLIDNFLANETPFKPVTREISENPLPDHAEKAIVESPDIITETFASLLLSQGNYEKALQAYEKLSLKYPEKSIYFATRIQEVIDLKNKK
jgi:hypothetical protein